MELTREEELEVILNCNSRPLAAFLDDLKLTNELTARIMKYPERYAIAGSYPAYMFGQVKRYQDIDIWTVDQYKFKEHCVSVEYEDIEVIYLYLSHTCPMIYNISHNNKKIQVMMLVRFGEVKTSLELAEDVCFKFSHNITKYCYIFSSKGTTGYRAYLIQANLANSFSNIVIADTDREKVVRLIRDYNDEKSVDGEWHPPRVYSIMYPYKHLLLDNVNSDITPSLKDACLRVILRQSKIQKEIFVCENVFIN